MIERETADGWAVYAAAFDGVETSVDITPGAVTKFRVFDGVRFLSDAAWYFTDEHFVVSGVCAARDGYTSDAGKWEAVGHVATANNNGLIYWGQTVTFVERIENAFTGELLKNNGSNIKRVSHSLYKRHSGLFSSTVETTPVYENRDAETTCVLETAQTSDIWDGVEYNFVLTPPNTVEEPFLSEPGEYLLRVTIELSTGAPIVFVYEFSVL